MSAYAFRAELNGKYLQSSVCRNKAGGSGVEASADTVAGNARARFLLEPSKEEGRHHMHVRCCYNKKYWVAVQVQEQDRWIIGTADEPQEDLSSSPSSCTLFQALPDKYKHNTYRFLHSGLNKFACAVSIGGKTYLQLDDGVDQENRSHNFTVCSVPRKDLPKHVAFKGVNGKYLGTYPLGRWPLNALSNVGLGLAQAVSPVYFGPAKLISHQEYLQFHVKDTRDARAIFTTFTNADGTVRIKSSTCGFWRRNSDSDDFISTPEVRDDNDPADSLFEVVNGDGFVALRNLGNNKFCRSLSIHLRHCLRADDDTISNYARFKLEEPVISQEIYDVEFNFNEARIYNNELISVDSDVRTNHTKEVQTGTFSFKKTTEVVSTWGTTVSSKTVVGKKFFSRITPRTPVVLGNEVTLSTESASSRRDTGSSRYSEERTMTQNFTMSAGETITAKFVARRASCDVPFSYKQKSVLTNGEEIVTDHDDGIYTGVNKYDFRIILTPS